MTEASEIRDAEPTPPPTSRQEWLAFVGVLAAAAAVRLIFFVGVVRLDMFRYVEVSNHVLLGGSLFDKSVFYASSRLTLLGPLLLLNKLFGYGEHITVAWPLVCSLVSVAGVFFLGRELFGPRVGLLAAVCMAFAPLQIELGTQLLPDPVEGAFIVLAVLFGVLAITRDRHWRTFGILSGISLALAYFTRVNAVVLLPGILAIGAILDIHKWKRSFIALAGIAGTLAAAAGVFWILAHDPLADWHKTMQFYSSYSGHFVFRGQRFWRQMLALRTTISWILPALAVGTVWGLVKRQPATWLMLVWAYGFWFYLDVVSPLHGLDTSYRYLEPMSAPTLLLFAGAVWWIAGMLPKHFEWAPVGAAVLVFVALLPVAQRADRGWRNNRHWSVMRGAAQYALEHGGSLPVYAQNTYVAIAVNYYGGYRFGRDTLEPLTAPVNAHARLFATTERTPSRGQSALLIGEWAPRPAWNPVVSATFQGVKRPLKVWRIHVPG